MLMQLARTDCSHILDQKLESGHQQSGERASGNLLGDNRGSTGV